MIYFISGSAAIPGGSEEDYAQLYVNAHGAMLIYVSKRDVDEQISTQPGLTEDDFDGEYLEITNMDEFQMLVDKHFVGHDARRWFKLGVA